MLMAHALSRPDLVSLAAGFVDQATLPADFTREAFDAIGADPDEIRVALQYGTTIGYPPLRRLILQRLLEADGIPLDTNRVSIDRIIITAGSNQLLFLVGDTAFDPGDIMICGAPSYFVYLGSLQNLGVRAVGVDVDENGILPEAVEARLAELDSAGQLDRVGGIYVTTYYDNPAGTTLPSDRRSALLDIARRWSKRRRILIIEDAAYRELRYEGEDLPSLWSLDETGAHTVLAGTFSKTFSPGLRVGWGVLPEDLVGPIVAHKGNVDFGSPNLNQHVMATVLARGYYDRHLALLVDTYREKCNTALAACEEYLGPLQGVRWYHSTGGLYVWVQLPEHIDTAMGGPLFGRAIDHGMLYVPGEHCYPSEGAPVRKNMIRLSFGVPSLDAIRRGIRMLADAIEELLEEL